MIDGEELLGSSSGEANKPKKGLNHSEISWHQCQSSCSSQIPSQNDPNYHQFLSLYKIRLNNDKTELIIYNTENEEEEIKVLDTELKLNKHTSITQLPNGELFCYGSWRTENALLIIDRNYGVRMLPSGIPCACSAPLYFDNNIYCFGGFGKYSPLALSRKFDLEKNTWIDLATLPETDFYCHSVIYNRNILVSGFFCKNLWIYSTEIESFSIISYVFREKTRKFLINVERLYLIEWCYELRIYESEDEYNWKPISNSETSLHGASQVYCLYNKEKFYFSAHLGYFQFDLKKKVLLKMNKS